MKNPWNIKLGVVLLCAVLLTACGNDSATSTQAEASPTVTVESNESASGGQLASIDLTQEIGYDDDDSYTDWTSSNPTEIKLNGTGANIEGAGAEAKESTITITSAGTYAISGKLDDGQIVIDVPDKGTVRLVLNGAEIHNSSTSAIYVAEAGKTIISLPEGTVNLVSDGETYVYPDASADEPNSAIFSKDDLTINGAGKLVVQGNYNNGITSKDDLKITGGTIEIHAADDGLMGRDLVAVQAGDVTIEAGGHGIKTTNDAEDSLGFIAIAGGTFDIKSEEDAVHSSGGIRIAAGTIGIDAGDDGIHAEIAISISGGTIDIANSNEGVEAATVDISGGEISVTASDDGVNIAGGNDETAAKEGPRGGNESGASSSNKLTISGGYLTVDAQGDGLDANGSIEMSGGTVIVNGPTNNGNGALDYDGTFVMSGGFLVAAGSSGMVQAASEQSTQPGVLMTFPQFQQAGTIVHLEDREGNDILTVAPSKTYQALFVSSPDLKRNASYVLSSGGTSTGKETNGLYDGGEYQGGTKVVEFETSSVVTWVNESGVTEARSGMMGGRGGNPGQGGGGERMPFNDGGERPQRQQ
jgi:hypothetical protein